MSIIRFTLIFILFLTWNNVAAQTNTKTITEMTRDADIVGNAAQINTKTKYELTKDGDVVRTKEYIPVMNSSTDFTYSYTDVDTIHTNTKCFKVEDFNPFVNESFFDSVISWYNTSNFEKMLFTNIDSLDTLARENRERFYKLFRKTYGAINDKTMLKREMITVQDTVKRYATLTYKGSLKNIKGEFSIQLNVTEKAKPYFMQMICTPYDYSELSFFSNIANSSLEYIKTKNLSSLKNEASKNLRQRIINMKKLGKSLELINCDSLKQFTSNLILDGRTTYARVVYDMLNNDKYLSLLYIGEDNKFKLDDLGFIDKKKTQISSQNH